MRCGRIFIDFCATDGNHREEDEQGSHYNALVHQLDDTRETVDKGLTPWQRFYGDENGDG